MEKSTKKKIIIIAVIDLLFALCFALSFFIYIPKEFIAFEFIALIGCGIINSFLIKDKTLWEHIKFFIPFSIGIAILFEMAYICYIPFLDFYRKNYFVHINSIISASLFINIAKVAFMFFIGTLVGAAFKKTMNKTDRQEQVREKLSIRLIVYPIFILIVFFLCGVLWLQYKNDNPKEARLIELKLLGIDYCATPEEAIMKFSEALKKGDKRKAASYIYDSGAGDELAKIQKKGIYKMSKKEMKELGEELPNGHFKNDWSDEWVVEDIVDGKLICKALVDFVDAGDDGWKINNY